MATWLGKALLLAVAVLQAGCGGKAEAPPIRIGHLSPRSGPDKAVGQSARRGILLAVEEANKAPEDRGAGRPVMVWHTDTHGDPQAFGAEATRLVSVNRVAALIGGRDADEIKEFKRLDRAGVLLISPAGLVNQSLAGSAVFFTGLSPAQQGQALARFAAQKGFGHVLILASDQDQGERCRVLADAFKDSFPQAWAKDHPKEKPAVTGPWHYGKDPTIQDRAEALRKELARAEGKKGAKPDAVLVAGKPADVKKLRQELGPVKLPVLFGGHEGSLKDLLEEADTRSGVWLATAFAPDAGTDRVKEFIQRFKDRFGEEPDVHAALAYDSARLLFRAMRQAKASSGEPVHKELDGLKDYASLTGPLCFDKNQQAQRAVFIMQLEGGKATTAKRYPPGP